MKYSILYPTVLMLLVETPTLEIQHEHVNVGTEHMVCCHNRRRHRTLHRGLQTLRGEAAFLKADCTRL